MNPFAVAWITLVRMVARDDDRPLTLYGNQASTSPYVLSCFVALREKGLSFEVKPVSLPKGEHHERAYAALSLTSRVPTLADGEFALSESSAIVEYLEERYAPPGHPALFPSTLHARARCRQIMAWLRSDLNALRVERTTKYLFYPHDALPALAPLSREALGAIDKLLYAAERLVPPGEGAMFGGWCIADTDLATMLQRLVQTRFALPSRLATYAARQWERPSVQEFVHLRRPPFDPTPYPHRQPISGPI